MTDFHTHILPGIDDGSQNLEETRRLLAQEMQQGVDCILATPHFYAGRDTEEHFFKKRERALAAVRETLAADEDIGWEMAHPSSPCSAGTLRDAERKASADADLKPTHKTRSRVLHTKEETVQAGGLPGRLEPAGGGHLPEPETTESSGAEKKTIPEIRAAAEVYYFPHMGEADILPRLCMEGGNLLLLEMPFVQWTESMYRDVERILRKQKLTVMLAHVERYWEFQRDKGVWNAVFDLPVYPQINAGSLLRFRSRGFVLKFLKAGHKVLLGSDCHHSEYRPVNLVAGREVIRKKLGEGTLKEMDLLGEELWEHAGK